MRARTPVELGLVIRERRRQLGWDQRQLAARVGVSRQWVIDVEKGKPGTELGLVLRALRALQLDLFLEPESAPPARSERAADFDPLDAALKRARGEGDD